MMHSVAPFLLRLCFSFLSLSLSTAQVDSRIPDEVRYLSGYVNRVPKPSDFTSAMLWGIAIADTHVHGHEKAQIEIAHTTLSCRVDGRDVTLNDDSGDVRGGLYRRHPWFGADAHDPIPLVYSPNQASPDKTVVTLRVGQRPDRVWHFWSASPRTILPAGHLEGCTVRVRVRISAVRCCRWGWITGATQPSATVPAGTITKRVRAGGIFLRTTGKKQRSRISSHDRVGRTLLSNDLVVKSKLLVE